MTNKALLIIDVQNYFIKENTLDIPDKIAAYIENNSFDFLVFTKFINNEESSFFKLLNWQKCTSSPDIDIDERLVNIANKSMVFEKNTYSIFKAKGLREYLDSNNIKVLYMCGIDTDSCILASMYEAFDMGYESHILKHLTFSRGGEDLYSSALKIIKRDLEKDINID